MTVEQIKERIAKAEEKKAKKLNTIEKKTKSIEKKMTALSKLIPDAEAVVDDRHGELRKYQDDANWGEIYGYSCDISWLKDDILRLNKEIPEIDDLIAKYNVQLENAEKVTLVYDNLPEIMKECEADMVAEWDAWDANYKARLREKYNEYNAKYPSNSIQGYKDFLKEFRYAGYEFMHEDAETTHKNNVKAARAYILDLYNRVIEVTGDITNVSDLHLAGHALNGFIKGVNGNAEVRTILAGGYNIQRLHNRTIVVKH